MQSLQSRNDLSKHVGGKAHAHLRLFNVHLPLLETVAAVGHENLAEMLAALVGEHLRQALQAAALTDLFLEFAPCPVLSLLLKQGEYLNL